MVASVAGAALGCPWCLERRVGTQAGAVETIVLAQRDIRIQTEIRTRTAA
jgi:hypothetical protein